MLSHLINVLHNQLNGSHFRRELLRLFMCKELIDFDGLQKLYGEELLKFDIFNQGNSHGKKCWAELKNRVIEHVG